MKKLLLIMIICILILIGSFLLNFPNNCNDSKNLDGAYQSVTKPYPPYPSISFDLDDNWTFYFYYFDNETQTQKLDKGKYYRKDDNVFVLNSGKFINQKINHKNNSFTLTIDGVKHTFKKINDHPIIIELPPS